MTDASCSCRGCTEPTLDGYTTYSNPYARAYHEVIKPAVKRLFTDD